MNCNVCGSTRVKHKFKLTEKLEVFSCGNCRVEFMHPQLSDEEINELYSEAYYKSWGISGETENESSKQMKIATFLLRLEQIQKYIRNGNILDVGCATGYFLEAAQSLGYTPYGIELSEYSATLAKKKFGDNAIYNGTLETNTFKPGTFQVITMFDLIEHVRVPVETLSSAGELLDANGILVITTPDNSSFSNKVMGKKWTHYKKEHFYYFNLPSLDLISKKSGFEIIYSEKSKKALNIDYLHTQWNTYQHWLFTPLINLTHFILPEKLTKKNFYLAIGEITVFLRKKRPEDKA
jgi:2-polyprenyl-3-methyl-5-hydroxy-6-metoxy-1,4-benzoquinol methylase